MSAIVALFKFKATYCLTDTGFDEMLQNFGDMLPDNNTLPSSFHETKKIFKSFELGYEKIHACVDDCCLFRHDLELVGGMSTMYSVLRDGKLLNAALRLKKKSLPKYCVTFQ